MRTEDQARLHELAGAIECERSLVAGQWKDDAAFLRNLADSPADERDRLWKAVKLRIGGEERGREIAKQNGDMPKSLGHGGAIEAYESVLGLLSEAVPPDSPAVGDSDLVSAVERLLAERRGLGPNPDKPRGSYLPDTPDSRALIAELEIHLAAFKEKKKGSE